jgi:hypothetical protein
MTNSPGAGYLEPVTSFQRPRVICIAGTGQNGATLLTRMLGRLPGVVAVGELGYLWDWGLLENRACGCGLPFRDCPFWTKVGETGFGGWGRVDPNEMISLRRVVTSVNGRVPQALALGLILVPSVSATYRADLRRYAEATSRLYRAVASVARARVVIDSMKRPSHVYMVSRQLDLDVRVLHLVRDSRGVAHSNLKWVRRQTTVSRQRSPKGPYRVRRPPAKAAARWLWINLSFELLAALRVPTVRVRYEALVRSPRAELERIAGKVGIGIAAGDLGFIQDGSVDLGPDHLVAGNRMRLEAGAVRLRADEEWRSRMDPRDVRTVSALTWPLLRRYGYSGAGVGARPDR